MYSLSIYIYKGTGSGTNIHPSTSSRSEGTCTCTVQVHEALLLLCFLSIRNLLISLSIGNHQCKKETKDENPLRPKPEKQGGMTLHRPCPAKRNCKEKDPKYHEEQQKDVARIIAAFPPKTVSREHKYINEQNVACRHYCKNAMNENP
jgi:hypothetical protein